MHRLHAAVVRPLLAVVEPSIVVEVGAGQGRLTARLLADAAQSLVHAVDPEPRFDAALLARDHDSRLILHRTTSEEALVAIGPCDLAILDGDPNHRAVLADLTALATLEEPPVVVVHHTGWPFGRRDGFYREETNPEAVAAGVRPGRRDADSEGLRFVPFVAATDVGAENGVQRAIDRHLGSRTDWRSVAVPGLHGCAILCPPQRLTLHRELSPLLRDFATAQFLAAQVRRVERAHLTALVDVTEPHGPEEAAVAEEAALPEAPQEAFVDSAEHERLVAAAAQARGELDATVRELERAHAEAAKAIERAAGAQAANDRLDLVVAEQREQVEQLRAEIAEQTGRTEALESERELTRSELRTSREDAARRASDLDHLAAQLADARRGLEAFVAERLLTRRQRFARAVGRLRGRRERESDELRRALQALAPPEADADRIGASDREQSR